MNKPLTHRARPLACAVALALAPAVPLTAHADAKPTAETATGMPYTLHQYSVLSDFRIADADGDGRLSDAEYTTFAERRAAKRYAATIHQRNATGASNAEGARDARVTPDTVAGMPASPHQKQALREFGATDKSGDDYVDYIEVYYYETFERPGVFPPRDESVPQDMAGHWETLVTDEHPPVHHTVPFSGEALKQAVRAGGFESVDENNDGVVSLFEANDRSMLYWTQNIYQFESADMDGDWSLDPTEFKIFQKKVADTMLEAERAGEFPPKKS